MARRAATRIPRKPGTWSWNQVKGMVTPRRSGPTASTIAAAPAAMSNPVSRGRATRGSRDLRRRSIALTASTATPAPPRTIVEKPGKKVCSHRSSLSSAQWSSPG